MRNLMDALYKQFLVIILMVLSLVPCMAQRKKYADFERNEKVFVTNETMTTYLRGRQGLRQFIESTLYCPQEVKQTGIHGKVVVSFTITKTGTVRDIQIAKTVLKDSLGILCNDSVLIKLCEQEAVRVCQKNMKWIPGRRYLARVKTRISMPIMFNEPQDFLLEDTHYEEVWDEDFFAQILRAFEPEYQWKDSLGSISVTKEMKMKFNKPKAFCEDDSEECFDNYFGLSALFTSNCMVPQLLSNDGRFISFLHFFPIFREEYKKRLDKLFYRKYPIDELLERHHRLKMRDFIKGYHGNHYFYDLTNEGKSDESWMEDITAYSMEEAHKKFNADSAFIFNLHLRPADYYKKDFKHLKVLLIQREGRGYACIYSFYTDEAKANLDKYWRKVEKMLRFVD